MFVSVSVSESRGEVGGGGIVEREAKSNIPSLTINPFIRTGLVLDTLDSVKARDVARVPPRKEP